MYTTIPSQKGQVTIPSPLREKYNIGKKTPILIEDKGQGILVMKVMHLVDHNKIHYYENEKEVGVSFPKGIDPQAIIDAIDDIDG